MKPVAGWSTGPAEGLISGQYFQSKFQIIDCPNHLCINTLSNGYYLMIHNKYYWISDYKRMSCYKLV